VLSFYEREEEKNDFVPLLSHYCERLEVIYRGQTFDAPNILGLKPPEIIHEFYHKRMEKLVREHLLSSRFDLIQCEFLQTGHFAYVDPRIPALLTNHELVSLSYANRFDALPWTSCKKFSAMVSWMRMFNYEEKLLRRFAAVVVLTKPEREFLARYAPQVSVYDHATGVDCDFFSPTNEPPEKDSVIFVGNFRHGPNVGAMDWFLARVWPGIRAAYRDAHLYIVGGNPPHKLRSAHGHEGVIVTGWVEDVRPYLQRAAVFVAPVFEGVGLRGKVLEAWAMEKPVVGTRLSFEALNAKEGESCFIADDPERFAARTCELLKNEQLATRMGAMARQIVVDSFSWDAFGEMYDRIYQDILGS
jgi:glycosyltransferase involved in cell wall biosynthesis